MAKTPMRCPFNDKLCKECQIYRGRHYYLCAKENYRGHIKTTTEVKDFNISDKFDMATFKKVFEPWTGNDAAANPDDIKMKIKVINREDNTEKYVTLAETKNWDWGNTVMMRTVNGKHVTSWVEFSEIVRYQNSKGTTELIVFEAPAFMVA